MDESVVHYIRDAVHKRFLGTFVEDNLNNSRKTGFEGQLQFELEALEDQSAKTIKLRQSLSGSGVRGAVLAAQYGFLLSASEVIGDTNYCQDLVRQGSHFYIQGEWL